METLDFCKILWRDAVRQRDEAIAMLRKVEAALEEQVTDPCWGPLHAEVKALADRIHGPD
jgi:hypothetical protein